jgi:hypothetical protein
MASLFGFGFSFGVVSCRWCLWPRRRWVVDAVAAVVIGDASAHDQVSGKVEALGPCVDEPGTAPLGQRLQLDLQLCQHLAS